MSLEGACGLRAMHALVSSVCLAQSASWAAVDAQARRDQVPSLAAVWLASGTLEERTDETTIPVSRKERGSLDLAIDSLPAQLLPADRPASASNYTITGVSVVDVEQGAILPRARRVTSSEDGLIQAIGPQAELSAPQRHSLDRRSGAVSDARVWSDAHVHYFDPPVVRPCNESPMAFCWSATWDNRPAKCWSSALR